LRFLGGIKSRRVSILLWDASNSRRCGILLRGLKSEEKLMYSRVMLIFGEVI
jgi:hypothetical protein